MPGENEELNAGANLEAEAPLVPTQGVVAEGAQQPEGSVEAGAEAPVVAAAEPAPAPAKKDWRDQRIAQLTARLRQQPAPAAVEPAPGAVQQPGESVGDFEARVAAEVERRTTGATFVASCNAAASAAKTVYGETEFNGALGRVQAVVDATNSNEVQAYNRFLEVGLETGQLGKLVMLLGEDQNRAAEILAMSPTKMAVELAKMSAAVDEETGKEPLPKPITPVAANSRGERSPIDPTDPLRADKLSTAEWMKRRNEQVAAQRGGRR